MLYGEVWGSDQIFSFHPWDESRYVEFNRDNRRVRPAFAEQGVVVKYDPAVHGSDLYRKLK